MKQKQKLIWTTVLVLVTLVVAIGLIRWQLPSNKTQMVASTIGTVSTPSPGRVTMIDLGATECIPCKMMAPILAELKEEYAGRADIMFIDVWKDPAQAKKYGIQAIPTQIFFDADGNEVFRHTGFMDKKRIVEALSRLGVT